VGSTRGEYLGSKRTGDIEAISVRDALRIASQLKDQFPQHDTKVGIAKTRNSIEDVKRGSVFH
jgi:hypothetical protein